MHDTPAQDPQWRLFHITVLGKQKIPYFTEGVLRENHLLFIRKTMTLNQVLNNTVWPI